MRQFLLLVVLLGSTLTAFGQQYFNNRYSNNNTPYQSGALSILPTDSGYVTWGQAYDYPVLGRIAGMIRLLDFDGRQRRVRYFSNPNRDFYTSYFQQGLCALPDGGFAGVGTVELQTLADTARGGPMLWRFSATGDTLWTRRYVEPIWATLAYGMCRVPTDGGFALIGIARQTPASADSLLVVRTDSVGTLLWRRCYGFRATSEGYSISARPDGGLLLGGFTRNSLFNSDTYVVCTDPQGNVRWQRAFDFRGSYDGTAVPISTRDGHVAVAASVNYGPIGQVDGQPRLAIYKLNGQTGATLWRRIYGPVSYLTENYAFHELADGSLVAAGQWDAVGRTNQPYGRRPADSFILKVCPDGDSLWLRTYAKLTGPQSSNYLRGMSPTPDGGFVGCGFLHYSAPDVGPSDSWVFKVDSAGYLQAGGAPVGVVCRTVGLPDAAAAGAALTVSPNPVGAGSALRLTLPAAAPTATATLRDVLGRRVGATVRFRGFSADVPTAGLAAGTYLLEVRVSGQAPVVRRVVVE